MVTCLWRTKWLNSNGKKLRFKRVGKTLPNVTAVAFSSPGKTTQRIKRDTSMTYERWGIPPLYVRACSHLYRKRGWKTHYCERQWTERYQLFTSRLQREVSNWKVAFQHCHRFHSGRVPLSLLSLFCLRIDVDPPFLSESTMVSCCHCFVIRPCSYFHCGAAGWRGPFETNTLELSSCAHVRFEVYKGPPQQKRCSNMLMVEVRALCDVRWSSLLSFLGSLHNGKRKGQEDPY